MKLPHYITTLFLCVSLLGCSTPSRESRASQEFASSVDELCSWTGMSRSGRIRGIERWRTANPGYNVSVRIAVDGSTRPYLVRFDLQRHLLSFTPEPFDLSMSQGLGYDTVKSPKDRSRCIAAVNDVNRHLRWTWYGRAAIQKVGSDFIVTYETVSPAEQKKHMYLDPYVSFLVTPKGTVFATFFGA